MVLIPVSCIISRTSFLSSSGTLSDSLTPLKFTFAFPSPLCWICSMFHQRYYDITTRRNWLWSLCPYLWKEWVYLKDEVLCRKAEKVCFLNSPLIKYCKLLQNTKQTNQQRILCLHGFHDEVLLMLNEILVNIQASCRSGSAWARSAVPQLHWVGAYSKLIFNALDNLPSPRDIQHSFVLSIQYPVQVLSLFPKAPLALSSTCIYSVLIFPPLWNNLFSQLLLSFQLQA